MKPSLQKLQKFFKLEADRGFDNRAVVGGMERILDSWEIEARNDLVPEQLIQAISVQLRQYQDLDESQRKDALVQIWQRAEQQSGETQSQRVETANYQAESESPPPQRTSKPDASLQPASEIKQQEAPQDEPQPLPSQPDAPSTETKELASALNAPTTVLQNVGPKLAQTLGKLGLESLRDMLYYFPHRYVDYTQLKPINRLWFGEEVTVIATVQSMSSRPFRGRQSQITEAVVSDGTGALRVTWFNPYQARRLQAGTHIALSGKIDQYLGRLVMNNPEWEPLEQQQLSTNRIVPVYSLTAQITQRWLRRLMNQVITHWAPRVPDHIPENVRRSAELIDLSTALMQIHFPSSWERLKAARFRLAFDEIFLLQLGVLSQKRAWQERTARRFTAPEEWIASQISRLPFALTGVQERAIADVRADLGSGKPMNRLLQGDVGSGKTVVAAQAIAMIAQNGAQAAFMAPTSILAEQHTKSMQQLLAGIGKNGDSASTEYPLRAEEIHLMIGSTPESEKREIREGLANGTIKLVIGTHALIEEPVNFADLQLAIVDEQHRFGVEQRAALRAKGENPHLLVMTATPIPRSLALTIYGDLDLSIMDEMPPGRLPVETFVITPRERERAYRLICSQLDAGRQAFIVYPLVEESDQSDSKAAVEEHARLKAEVFPNYSLGLLHGRMSPNEKEEVMAKFHAGEYQILVSTSVVEVGVDVPNATVMLIEGAERFGLAQLHQFRGRVGRGGDKAYCLLVPGSADDTENERLQIMTQTNDGFILAERDLEQRGPGDFLGTRQSGYSELQLASLTDIHIIEKARRQALAVYDEDPNLELPGHQLLATALDRFWSGGKGDIS